ncbi:MAG: hypothetical protein ACLUFA_10425 [[Clostridium] leptum]
MKKPLTLLFDSAKGFFIGALKQGNNPPVLPWEEKSFHMRLSEGKQILERKRLNEKEI